MTISTAAAHPSDLYPYSGIVWRMVEAQHVIATMQLVDSLEEQKILEQELGLVKPRPLEGRSDLDYLLQRPFLRENYPVGSRFRRAGFSDGVYYASEHEETAAAETAFYRLLFFAESPETKLPSKPGQYSVFSVAVSTQRAVDVDKVKTHDQREALLNLSDYEASQTFAETVRAINGKLIRYPSVRDPDHRPNVALLAPDIFTSRLPDRFQSWHLDFRLDRVIARREHPSLLLEFLRSDFNDPRL